MTNTGAGGTSGAEALGYAITMVASTVLFLFGGEVLDGWIGTSPLFTVLGAMIGAGAGIYYMIVRLTAANRRPGDGDR